MSRWTPEQEAAITARGASLVVSAAAGSGKTSVLVERLIRLLSDTEARTPAEALVVVTFTNDAAAEVRSRLNLALTQKMTQEPENDWLRRQQTMLQSAHISTIHSFCFDLLREQFAAAGLSAGFRIIDENEEKVLRGEALSAVMEAFSKAAEEDKDTAAQQKLLLSAFCPKDDLPLETLILDIFRCVEAAPFGENLLLDAADACQGEKMRDAAINYILTQLDAVKTLQDRAKELMLPICTEKQTAVLVDVIVMADKLRSAAEAKDTAQLGALLKGMSFDKLNLPRKQESAYIRALHDHAKELLLSLQKLAVPLSYADKDLPRHAEILRALYRLVKEFDDTLFAIKQERGVIGFGDAMRLALRLLAERKENGEIVKTPLAEQLSEQYACIMIDEFQDADNQQDLIFRMLSHGGDANHYGDNLFVVGDSKQCIYRFRNANPNNFYRAMREGAPYVSPKLEQNTCIHLNRNFRSAKEVVETVNGIFTPLMTEQVGEIRYDDTQKLVQGAVYPDGNRPLSLLLLHTSKEEDTDEPRAVAAQIARHLAEGTEVTDRDGTKRPCRPKDFLILLRTATGMPRYAQALADAGVPVCPTEQSGYLDSQEIRLLLDMLRTVDNPLLDIPAAASMLSPMFGFTVDDMIAVRLTGKKKPLFHGVRMLAEDESTPDALRTKCQEFLDFLESMRLFSAMETPEQLIRRIYQQTDFLGLMQMSANGEQKKANLRTLTVYARQFEENRGGGLSAFLRYLDAILARKSDLSASSAPAVSEDVVTLKTIHKSKGLEAPFVILAHSDTAFSKEDDKKTFQFHSDWGFGFQLHDAEELTCGKTLPYHMIALQNRREAVSEELRLLYVALTRAREYLILPLTYSNNYVTKKAKPFICEQYAFGGQTDLLTASAGSMRDWLMMALLRNPSCYQLRTALGLGDFDADDAQPPLSVVTETVEAEAAPASAENAADTDVPNIDEALLQAITTQCSWHYDSPQADLPAKYGVSEIAHGEEFSAPLRRPLFVRERRGLSGAERGTALHTFMQYADFSAASENLEQEVARLETEGRLSAKQAKAVRTSTISAFFESDLYARICRADKLRREEKFTVRLSDLELDGDLSDLQAQYQDTEGMLIGIMDLVIEENGSTILVDYKTDQVHTGEELLERYTEQIRLYARALRLLDGHAPKECWLYSFALQKAIPVLGITTE